MRIIALAASMALPSAGAGDPMPVASLAPGELFFRLDGVPTFLLGRNPTGWQVEQFEPLLQGAGESGERMARIHLTVGMPPRAPAGEVEEGWVQRWDRVFDMAAANGIHVLPVFGVWADWNDGSRGEQWHYWHRNPFNAELGGPGS